ncbi:MAG: class I SAM-dependent methyltransferase, partial [Chitinophagaceae bacterium]|nr:class I SAM-dependent methyltransferase [Chitinophagaceae bacterium]
PQYWSENFEPYFLPLYRKALEKLALTKDDAVLDAGCGSGMFSSLAIKTGAEVVGIDAASALLEVARKRNPNNTFLEEDLEALPFANDSFDVVAGFNSFQYAGSFENALREAKRTLRPGGRLLIAIWDKPELSDGTAILKAISSLVPPPPPGTPGPFALSEDGKVETVLNNLGMHLDSKTSVGCQFIYSSLAEGVKSFMGTGPAANALNHTDRTTVENAIKGAMAPFHATDNFYFLVNHFLLFIARK